MKNKILKLFIMILLILPIVIKADNISYNSAITKTNNYMRLSKFSDKKKYINQDTKEYGFENGQVKKIANYINGGMLNKDEYLLSQVNEMSYLTLGLKYWTMTSNGGNQYYIENYLDSMEKTNTAGVRPTIYALPEVYVVGKGSYSIPWEFRAYHTVKITPKAYGTVACKSGDTTCSISNTTLTKTKIETGEDAEFIITPDSGYKYLANDTCNLKHVSGKEYQIKNIVNDIRCIVEFYPRTYTLNLSAGSGATYKTQPSPTKLYLKWTVGMFSDSNATNKVSSITPPTRTGYQFKGYYYGTTKVINEDGTIVSEQSKTITGFNTDGPDNQDLVAHWEANKMHITYDKNGATEYNDPPNSLNVTLLYDGTNYSRKEGLPNYACKKDDCWYAFSKAGHHGTLYWLVGSNTSTTKINVETAFAKNQDMFTGDELTSFEENKDTYVTLYAEWIQCEAGTYKVAGTGGTSCNKCTAGTFQPNRGATQCIKCAVGSYSGEKASACIACGAGKTTDSVGSTQSQCKNCTQTNVATWKTSTWTNNKVSNICIIDTCNVNYELKNKDMPTNYCELANTFSFAYTGDFKYKDGNNPEVSVPKSDNPTLINISSNDWYVKFLTSGTLTVGKGTDAYAFLVGGGGSGGGSSNHNDATSAGGGGGAGGSTSTQSIALTTTSYVITIGAGGQSTKVKEMGENGSATTAFGYTAAGGAAGGAGATWCDVRGYSCIGDYYAAGGPGGAGANGGGSGGKGARIEAVYGGRDLGGAGGDGTAAFGNGDKYGVYAGGGGGGMAVTYGNTTILSGPGGAGGGAHGSQYGYNHVAEANTGGGGGGGAAGDMGGSMAWPGGAGGSGIVIIKNP